MASVIFINENRIIYQLILKTEQDFEATILCFVSAK